MTFPIRKASAQTTLKPAKSAGSGKSSAIALRERKKPTPNKACEKCQTPFYAAPSHVLKGWGRFCSKACSSSGEANHRFKKNDVVCKCCGSEFHVKPSRQKRGKARVYCSDECRKKAQVSSKTCPSCQVAFDVPASHAHKRKFCSAECQKKSFRNSTPNRVCVTCCAPFFIKESDLKRVADAGTFCSAECMTRSRGKIRLEDGKYASHLERDLYQMLKEEGLLAGAVREYKFHPNRRWLFDFAWPEMKVAVEIHGGIWSGGRGGHTSGKGRLRDMEKMNEATMLGWLVLEVASNHLRDRSVIDWVRKLIELRVAA